MSSIVLRRSGVNYLEGSLSENGKFLATIGKKSIELYHYTNDIVDIQGKRLWFSSIELGCNAIYCVWSPDFALQNALLIVTERGIVIWRIFLDVTKPPQEIVPEVSYHKTINVYSAKWCNTAIPSVYLFHKGGVLYIEFSSKNISNTNDIQIKEFAINKRVLNCASITSRGYCVGASNGDILWDNWVPERIAKAFPAGLGSPGREFRRRKADPFLEGISGEGFQNDDPFSVHALIVPDRKSVMKDDVDLSKYSARSIVVDDDELCFVCLEKTAMTSILSGRGNTNNNNVFNIVENSHITSESSPMDVLTSIGGVLSNNNSNNNNNNNNAGINNSKNGAIIALCFLVRDDDVKRAAVSDELFAEMTECLSIDTKDHKAGGMKRLHLVQRAKLETKYAVEMGSKTAGDILDDPRQILERLKPVARARLPDDMTCPDVMTMQRCEGSSKCLFAIGSSKNDLVYVIEYTYSQSSKMKLKAKRKIQLSKGYVTKGLVFQPDGRLLVMAGRKHPIDSPLNLNMHADYDVAYATYDLELRPYPRSNTNANKNTNTNGNGNINTTTNIVVPPKKVKQEKDIISEGVSIPKGNISSINKNHQKSKSSKNSSKSKNQRIGAVKEPSEFSGVDDMKIATPPPPIANTNLHNMTSNTSNPSLASIQEAVLALNHLTNRAFREFDKRFTANEERLNSLSKEVFNLNDRMDIQEKYQSAAERARRL